MAQCFSLIHMWRRLDSLINTAEIISTEQLATKPIARQLKQRLQNAISGDVLIDSFSLGRYSTDASVYQMTPHAVVVPKSYDDVATCLTIAAELKVPVLPRGGGTSQCGQTVNHALVIDNTRYLNKLVELDVENSTCVVQPGIVLDELNRLLAPHGLWFPVDVSTASRATIGGMAANNSCGQRSVYYGTMRDNVLSIEALLADGSEYTFGTVDTGVGEPKDNSLDNLPAQQKSLYNKLLSIGADNTQEIAARFPKVQRRVGGYNIDALIQNTADQRPVHSGSEMDSPNMSHLLVGSEGTLAYFKNIKLRLWPLPVNKVLGVCHFPTFYQAMDAAQHLATLNPHAIELVDSTMIQLARDIDLFRPAVEKFVRGSPAAVLIVEFAFDDQSENIRHLQLLQQRMADIGYTWDAKGNQLGGVVEAIDSATQSAIAEVRKAGLNIMMSMKSQGKPVSFVEDCAVELKDLAEYTRGLTEIFHKYGTEGTWYAHASVGCLHVRPVLNLKLEKDAEDMRSIADEAFDLVLKYKGSHSGEHGDGISRSEFHEKMFGAQLVQAFKEVKAAFDPHNLFNPGKITNAPRMNDRTLLRYHPGYAKQTHSSQLDWSPWSDAGDSGFQGAVEMCNNNGACRKLSGGVMCPSYRITRNERDVTRGRANSLRLALSGQLGEHAIASDDMKKTMELCVSCKACRRECPTGVDMAKMKIEVLSARARLHGYSLHERLIAELPRYAPFAVKISALLQLRNRVPLLAKIGQKLTGFSAKRPLPSFSTDWFSERDSQGQGDREVVLLADTFNTWFEPRNLRSAVTFLKAAGYQVHIAQSPANARKQLCCGRTYLAVGMVDKARVEAKHMADALYPYAQRGVPIIGLEPSCLLTLRDEHLSLLPGEITSTIASNAYMFEEFIAAEQRNGKLKLPPLSAPAGKLLLHGHCHQKAFDVMSSVEETLRLIPGVEIEKVESSCCGMAGSFGYNAETYEASTQMAQLDLIPAIKRADASVMIVADGTSCRHQIDDLAGREALHVARVLELALMPGPNHQPADVHS